jgi:hypothetical protein
MRAELARVVGGPGGYAGERESQRSAQRSLQHDTSWNDGVVSSHQAGE